MITLSWRPTLLLILVAAMLGTLVAPAPASAAAAAPRDPAVGVQMHAMWLDMDDATRRRTMDLLADAGATWIRVDVGWSSIEEDGPTPNPYWTGRTRDVLTDARARGLQTLVTLWRTPEWENGNAGVYAPPVDAKQYQRFTRWFAQQFGDLVGAYEIWNEPNQSSFFKGTAADYVRVLKAGYAGLHAGDRDAVVVLGGPAYNDTDWLEEIYRLGAGGHFDVMSTHPYMAPSNAGPETPDTDGKNIWLLSHVEAVHALMKRQGDGGKPIWFTEFGWFTGAGPTDQPWDRPVTEKQQADYLVRTIDLVAERYPYVTHVFWYNARDRASGHPRHDSYGLLRRDLTPKPALKAMRDRLVGPTGTRPNATTATRTGSEASGSTSPACADVTTTATFSDLGSSVHGGGVDCMASWGVVKRTDGTNDGRFRIGERADRAFIAAVIDRLMSAAGTPLPAATRDRFSDDDGHPYEGAINRVAQAGISTGFSDGTYRPTASLTRAQMATLLATAYRHLGYAVPSQVSDAFADDEGNVHEANIDLAAELAIASGTSATTYAPGSSLTRGQLTTFASRLADHVARNRAA